MSGTLTGANGWFRHTSCVTRNQPLVTIRPALSTIDEPDAGGRSKFLPMKVADLSSHPAIVSIAACFVLLASETEGQGAAFPAPERPAVASIFADGVISDENEQWRITFTRDRKAAYFAESPGFFPATRQATIYTSELRDGAWTSPVVASFSGRYSDIDPFISPDGERLYFSSIRPVNGEIRGDVDIWMVERRGDAWSDPVHLGPEINSGADELYPSASADGTLYFASGPESLERDGHFDIYAAKRNGSGFLPRHGLGPGVNTVPSEHDPHLQAAWEFNPEITSDGKTLFFTSLRPGGFGFGDLYVSRCVNGEWTAAVNVGPAVNTSADEYHPTISLDGGELFFVRRRPGKGDFYRVPLSALEGFR